MPAVSFAFAAATAVTLLFHTPFSSFFFFPFTGLPAAHRPVRRACSLKFAHIERRRSIGGKRNTSNNDKRKRFREREEREVVFVFSFFFFLLFFSLLPSLTFQKQNRLRFSPRLLLPPASSSSSLSSSPARRKQWDLWRQPWRP